MRARGEKGPLAARKCSKIVAETKNGYSQVVGKGEGEVERGVEAGQHRVT